MSEYLIRGTTLSAIANAIREKTGGTEKMTPEKMATEISNIKSGDDGSFKSVIERTVSNPTLPSDLTSIGSKAFYGYSNLALTSLPSGVTKIGDSAFNSCTKLALTSLPSGLTSIGNSAFKECTNLALTSLPSGLTSIGSYAFNGCAKLTSITFEGTPTTIDRTAFSLCSYLTTINVPWAEGAVANAPWGATNATINYNYTGS